MENSTMNNTFTNNEKKLSLISFWITFALTQIYGIVSGIALSSSGTPVESGIFLSIMALLVVLMGPFLIFSMIMLHKYSIQKYKPFSMAALIFMTMCVTITTCNNFLLLFVNSNQDLFDSFIKSLFLPCKWPVFIFVLDNFTWDWFFGISMILIAPVLKGNRLMNITRYVVLLSGILCLLGLLLTFFAPQIGIYTGIIGWGAVGPIAFLLMAKAFEKI